MMRRKVLLTLTLALVLVVPPFARAGSYAASNNAFALDLYRQIASTRGEESIFFSPFSMSAALTMAWAGADGVTADEMADVLHYDPADRLTPHGQIRDLIEAMTAHPDENAFVIDVANDLWRDTRVAFRPAFMKEMSAYYDGSFRVADFKSETEKARLAINKRIAQQTRDKIPELLKEGDVTADTIALLTNAIYLKGMWEIPFDRSDTYEGPFHLTTGDTVTVPIMRQREERFNYLDGDGFQAVELPYKGGRASMILLVPDDIDGLPLLENKLTLDRLNQWIGAMKATELNLNLPKFTLRDRNGMKRHLLSLGMESPFHPDADFSRMFQGATGGPPMIDNVIHEAFIEIDEEKTEAAAATGIGMAAAAYHPIPFVNADRRFLYLIRDKESGAILFLGRQMNPLVEQVGS